MEKQLIWSDERPTEHGIWWWRYGIGYPAMTVEIDVPREPGLPQAEKFVLVTRKETCCQIVNFNGQRFPVDALNGQWAGPVMPPVESGEVNNPSI